MATTKNAASHLKASQLFMRTAFPLSILLSLFSVLTVVLSMFCRILTSSVRFSAAPIIPLTVCAKSLPMPFIILGKRLWEVKPGMVFTSLNTISFCPYKTGPPL